jgi:hypothetical protein
MVTAFDCVNKWFKVNLLSINVNETHYIQFKTKRKPTLNLNILCNDNPITILPNINPLTPELNPSAQRCLTRCSFTGDFAS